MTMNFIIELFYCTRELLTAQTQLEYCVQILLKDVDKAKRDQNEKGPVN
jgi:hypothetical protein